MPEVNDLLNSIWSEYNRAGIADDFAIILRVAELLTLDLGYRVPNVLQFAELDRRNEELRIDRLIADLEEAAEKAGGKAQLFDRYVLFRLTERLPGVRFPTPRHVVKIMQHLARISPEDTLADLACGSGGFLVSHTKGSSAYPKESIGIDISPEWVALAWANTILHDTKNVDITVGNALRVCGYDGNLYRKTFDRILMAPPFGLSVDPWLVERAIGFGVGSSSETALTALALEKLAKGGRAALLVPTGLLFRNGTGEKWLRKELVQMCDLEAIITLPKDSLQPFSSLQAHLLLVHKPYSRPSFHQSHTWFFQTEFDGYPVGRGRDLTELPKEPNDLSFVEAIILNHDKSFDETFPTNNTLVGVKRFRVHNHFFGITVQALNNTHLLYVERFSLKSESSIGFLLVEATNLDTHNTIRVHIALDGEDGSFEESRSPKELSEEYNSWRLFEGNEADQSVAITENCRLLGVTASTKAQIAKSYDLRPDQYAQMQDMRQAATSPAGIVERIQLNQSNFLQKLDGLSLRIGLMDNFLQSQIVHVQEDARPLAGLSGRQQQIWDQIFELTEDEATEGFSVQKLQNLNPSLHSKELMQTLDLLENMGVIIPITKINQKTLQADENIYYTRVTTQDGWVWNE